jgi:methyltransferase (TIGR00027 family)
VWESTRDIQSAQRIAFARLCLTNAGVLADPFATQFVYGRGSALGRVLQLAESTGLWKNRPFAWIAARTRFYDEVVVTSLDKGIDQVLILGAGYDSRAWRLARNGVRYFEVDRSAVQADKRRRAPAGGPTYVSADLVVDRVGSMLTGKGFDAARPTVIVSEGLSMYLVRESLCGLLRDLADLAAPGSVLAIDFFAGAADIGWPCKVLAAANHLFYALLKTPLRFELRPEEADRFLSCSGWVCSDLFSGPDLHSKYFAETDLAVPRGLPGSYVVRANRENINEEHS